MSEAATATTAEAPAVAPPEPADVQSFCIELYALDCLLRERGTSIRDLLGVAARNAYGVSDLH